MGLEVEINLPTYFSNWMTMIDNKFEQARHLRTHVDAENVIK